MDRDRFAALLDSSLQDFRDQLLDAYAGRGAGENTPATPASTKKNADTDIDEDTHDPFEVAAWKKVEHLLPSKERGVSSQTDQTDLSVGRNSSLTPSEEGIQEGPKIFHGRSSEYLRSGLLGVKAEEAMAIRHRLRVRLGALSSKTLVSGKSLLEAVTSLGLTRYTEQDMNDLVNALADFISLSFEQQEMTPEKDDVEKSDDLELFFFHKRDSRAYGHPVWQWPEKTDAALGASAMRRSVTGHMNNWAEVVPRSSFNVVPAQAIMEIFLSQEADVHKRMFGPRLLNQFRAMKEILLAGDTNRLVAELTFVRINDLAAPPEPVHPLMYIEPLVAVLIVGNGIMIGLQTEPGFDEWPGWTYVELVFAAFLLLEIALRMHLLRCRNYWCGTERWWNWFDLFLAATGILDIAVQMVGEEDSAFAGASLLRFCRLIRLVRIVKVFRIKFMKDLRLMVKGLTAGVRTLALAFLLLFAVLYVISGFATMTIGSDTRTKELGLEEYFYNIPAAMFTAFRCFNGECVNRRGEPINFLLADAFGLPFILFYVISYMLVTMGIFNVILAVYVDITMKAAKENDAVTAEQHARESIRVARTTRELLKKFAGAYHVFNEEDGKNKLDKLPSHMLFTEEGLQDKVEITKELFLLVIQDRGVQKLMDDLDLPPDRANLFEIIDADGSGTLQITELLQGLLKIRGEINKSDTVASLLATKALQSMIGELKDESLRHFEDFHNELQQQFAEFCQHMTRSISKVKFRSKSRRSKDLNTLAAPLRPDDLPPEIEMEPP